MDKPISLSVKDYIIRKMSVKLMMSEDVLQSVIGHQFQSAYEAMSKNKSIELSGFGKLHFNTPKAIKKMEKMVAQTESLKRQLTSPECTDRRREITLAKIERLANDIATLKPMLEYEIVRDLRGLEEQDDSTRTPEETNSGSSEGTIEDLQRVQDAFKEQGGI